MLVPISIPVTPPTRFILLHTSHAGNIGAAARAMKTMGFNDLVLVAPRWPDVLQQQETIQRASGAHDVLERARIVATLDEALHGMHHLCATAMVPRDFGPPTREPRTHFEMLLKKKQSEEQPSAHAPTQGTGSNNTLGTAFLFGSERFGMSNEDVYRCHVALHIPTSPQFGSLNLAAAVQIIAYEWRQALGGFANPQPSLPAHNAQQADATQLAGLLIHWQQALADIGFLDPAAPKKLMPRLNQLCNRAQPTAQEIHILRGIARAMTRTAQRRM